MTNPYATGNAVYRGGSNIPTSGGVDPSGYIDRQLNPANNSTRRSGLAAMALDKLQGPRQQGQARTKNEIPEQFRIKPSQVGVLAMRRLRGQ